MIVHLGTLKAKNTPYTTLISENSSEDMMTSIVIEQVTGEPPTVKEVVVDMTYAPECEMSIKKWHISDFLSEDE